MNKLCILVLTCAAVLSAADKKIVVRALSGGFADDANAIALYKKAAGNDADVVAAKSQEQFAKEIVDAHGIIGGISEEQFATAKNLEWVQTTSAGVEAYSFWPEFMKSDVQLTNCKVVQGPTIGDHAFALLLALTRGLHEYIPSKEDAAWKSRADAPKVMTELPGMTAVIIGSGGIGTQIAQRAHGFGMNVIGVDPKDIPVSIFIPKIVKPDQLDEVLPLADVVFVAAPLTPQSENTISSKQFDLMKKGAFFIAVSRGRLYDKGALVKALDSQKLAGAGLDVTEPEPLPKDDALWKFDNVVITPHVASHAKGSDDRRLVVISGNVGRFARGEPLTHVVNKAVGY
jgi:phosphoglycerate dehydrogenase-like enzyme